MSDSLVEPLSELGTVVNALAKKLRFNQLLNLYPQAEATGILDIVSKTTEKPCIFKDKRDLYIAVQRAGITILIKPAIAFPLLKDIQLIVRAGDYEFEMRLEFNSMAEPGKEFNAKFKRSLRDEYTSVVVGFLKEVTQALQPAA